MRFVPTGVLSGFVNALALLIFQAQFLQLGIGINEGKLLENELSKYPTNSQIPTVWILVILGLIVIYGFPKITKVIPSQLVAIVLLTLISVFFKLEIPTVSDLGTLPNGFPSLSLPFGELANGKVPFNLSTLGVILPTSLAISLVGLMETFLTQDILDDATDTSSNKNKEARGQGIANIISSLFGGMAGCALVGQSVMNNENGGKSRLSTLISGLSLLLMIILLKPWIGAIPMAALVAIMITIAVSTADLTGLKNIRKIPKSDTAVMLMTFAVTMLTKPHNLALGVIAGVGLAAILFSRKVAKVITVSRVKGKNQITYKVEGQLFFVSKIYFLQGFDIHEHPKDILIDMSLAHIWDQSGVVALDQIIRKFKNSGSKVEIIGLNKESLNLFERLGGLETSH
jgi:SulP family sulfate permease